LAELIIVADNARELPLLRSETTLGRGSTSAKRKKPPPIAEERLRRGYADQPSVNHKLVLLTEYLPLQGPARCKFGVALSPQTEHGPDLSPHPPTPHEVGAIIIHDQLRPP
jgi:hypothetical protein